MNREQPNPYSSAKVWQAKKKGRLALVADIAYAVTMHHGRTASYYTGGDKTLTAEVNEFLGISGEAPCKTSPVDNALLIDNHSLAEEREERNQFIADTMATVIKNAIIQQEGAQAAYNACEPEIKNLIEKSLSLQEKLLLGLEVDSQSIERLLRRQVKSREEQRFQVQAIK